VKFEALAELSRKAEGIMPRSLLRNLFPKIALGFHTRDYGLKKSIFVDIGVLFVSRKKSIICFTNLHLNGSLRISVFCELSFAADTPVKVSSVIIKIPRPYI